MPLLRSLRLPLRLLLAGALSLSCSYALHASEPQSPEALVEALYAPYLKPEAEAPVPPLISEAAAGESTQAYLTGKLKQAVSAMMKAQKSDPGMSLGYDPLVDAQDFEITNFKVAPATKDAKATKAEVEATFLNFGEKRRFHFIFVQPEGSKRWLLSEVECKTGSDERSYSLQAELEEALKENREGGGE